MNYKLPTLAVGLLVFLGTQTRAVQSAQVDAEHPISDAQSNRDAGSAASRDGETVPGQKLVAEAAQRLLLLPGIEAKTRQRVHLFDQPTVGSGTYAQWTRPPRLLLRLDLRLQTGDQVSSLLQVSDGDSFWVRRDVLGDSHLSRVNVRKLREAASELSQTHPGASLPPSLWMAIGGLPMLLSHLEESFQFDDAQPDQVGQLPVWNLEGSWKPEILANLLPARRDAIRAGQPAPLGELPSHIPHGVTLILGRDAVIPLFPYSVSFFRFAPGTDRPTARTRREPIVTWELFEVRVRPDLTAGYFDYRPGDQPVEERTEEFIARLRAAVESSQRK
jgi:hypothetical protein